MPKPRPPAKRVPSPPPARVVHYPPVVLKPTITFITPLPPAKDTYAAPTALPHSPPMLGTGCIGWQNVKHFGAVGDGKHNDAPAIASAMANRKVLYLYFPPGVYRLATNTKITKTVVMGTYAGHGSGSAVSL